MSFVQAGRTKPEDAATEVVWNCISLNIRKDGTATIINESQIKILKDSARSDHITKQIVFEPDFLVTKVLEAKTVLEDGKDFPVATESIETKPLASANNGFSHKTQILIPFEKVSVGSVVHLKTETHLINPQFKKFFNSYFEFTENVKYSHTEIEILSELPLFITMNDPEGKIKKEEDQTGETKRYKYTLTKPLIEGLTEPNTFFENKKRTLISVCSLKSPTCPDYSGVIAEGLEGVLSAPLPSLLSDFGKKASAFNNEVDQATSVMADLQESITYLGNWTGTGKLTPRTLEVITETGRGDCKDYSACLVAVLRSLGYEAYFASVFSSPNPKLIKNEWQHNHAIVKFIGKSGRIYWLDPTNSLAMADGIGANIADRHVIVHEKAKTTLEHIPPVDHKHAREEQDTTITFKEGKPSIFKGKTKLFGEAATGFISGAYNCDPSSLQEQFIGNKKVISFKTNYDGSRIVKDVEIEYEYEDDNEEFFMPTNLGLSFVLKSSKGSTYLNTKETDEGAVFVGTPESYSTRILYKGLKADGLETLGFAINSPWLEASRSLKQTPEGIEITEVFNVLTSVITPEDIRLPEFVALKKTLKKFHKMAIIVTFM
jgi:hypothetical protein